MTKRIFRSIFLTSLAALVLASTFIIFILYRVYKTEAINKLEIEGAYISHLINQMDASPQALEKIYYGDRITLIDEGGIVIYDNMTDTSTMDNHADRPEISQALREGTGKSYRHSDTLSQMTVYYAYKLNDGNILRISKTQSNMIGLLGDILPILIIIILNIAVLSFVVSRYMARQITSPINALDLDSPFINEIYDELSPLLTRIEKQNKNIKNQMYEITEKQRNFNVVTENMREGLILISAKGNILSINESASRIFRTNIDKCVGSHILTVNRSLSMHKVFEGAISGADTEDLLTINNKFYKLLGSPVTSKDQSLGAVILLLDVTDKHRAERSRRQFTANVSHELKTPLTSILGFAEIMKDGLSRPEDMQGFAGRIHYEASRLLTLIDDTIELSQLDEKTKISNQESIDLYDLAHDIINRLAPIALKKEVNLSIRGDHVLVPGHRKILEGMIYNLCDNAIKYNITGGDAIIEIGHRDDRPFITVSDTGIGIPKKHQSHIFERFYRADKSRGGEIDGTGLGLSIVKHGAMLHNITINMESGESAGTTFTLIFPPVNKALDD
ncbi:MAG: hypothetical protein GX967_02920 [Clostridiales bacterium]|nr:hypothetical protein [Clostridiales bacterium]